MPQLLIVRILRTLVLLAAVLSAAWVAFYFGFWRPERENARIASCQANIQQTRLAIAMYTADYGDTLPPCSDYFELAEMVHPYVKNWSLSFCLSRDRKGPEMFSYGWNYHLAGKRIDGLGSLAREPMLFDRKPWHNGKRNVISFGGTPYLTRAPVAQIRLPWSELRRYTYTSHRTNIKLRQAFRWHRWRAAERLYHQALDEAGDNPMVGPQLYEELIAVQCKLRHLDAAQRTWQEMKRKFPDGEWVRRAGTVVEQAKRGIEPDMERYYEDRFLAMWRY
ncbi:MAG: hypothetical protein HY318_15660 [Armatimonadetes bacterium]|nr:hypothetical protein [Armatimonadota bacterium]